MKVHPDADIFPMMPDDDLAALAEDIKANGQVHPIITGDYRWPDTDEDEEVLIDGRNRLKACEMAGVRPNFKKLNGEDQKAFILSVNINRRHMTTGQRAMAVAMMYPKPQRGGGPGRKDGLSPSLDRSYLYRCRTILAASPDLAQAVLTGAETVNQAFEEVQQKKKALENTEASMARLRAQAPDLADLVVEEKLKLSEGLSALDSRINEARRQQETATRVLQSIFNAIYPRGAPPAEWAERLTTDVTADFWSASEPLTFETLNACADVMRAIAERWKEQP